MTQRNQRILWSAAVIIAFVLGYLLGRRNAHCPTLNAGDGSVTGSSPAQAPGSPSRLKVSGSGSGDVASSGSSDASGRVKSGGGGGGGGGSGDDETSGHTSGSSAVSASGKSADDSAAGSSLAKAVVTGLGSGTSGLGVGSADAPIGPSLDTATAPSYRYDFTGLPRYANVSRVVSGIGTRKDISADTGTVAAMLTADSFESVSAWYGAHVPAGWHEQKIGNMGQVAAQFSPQNLTRMLQSAMSGEPTSDTAVSPAPAAPGLSVALWTAPDNDAHHYRGVLVTSAPGVPTHVILKRSVSQ
jgi:hypothetical protein